MSCILCNPSVTKTQGPCFECHRATDAEIGHRIAFLQAENVRLFNRLDTTNQRLDSALKRIEMLENLTNPLRSIQPPVTPSK